MMKHLDMAYYVNLEAELLKHVMDTFHENTLPLKNLEYDFDQIVIFATGSSSNAAHAAKTLLSNVTCRNIEIKEPSMALNYDLYLNKKTLYFAISQGGHSSSTIEIVKAIQEHHASVYVITSDKQSPLAKLSKHVLLLDIQEDMPFVTAGESATIVFLWMIGLYLGKGLKSIQDQEEVEWIKNIYYLIEQLPTCISFVDEWFNQTREELCKAQRFLCIGYGASYGAAKEFETKFTETVRVPSAGFELEEFMHGPYIGIQKYDYIFLFDPYGKLTKRMVKLRNFLQNHCMHIFYFTLNKQDDDQSLCIPVQTEERLSCLLFNIVAHLTSWYISQLKRVDLSKSSYPDFDVMMKSKI